ncbi:MAG TPA: FtsX-like permease family protein [Gaiellaceae bacterium]|nr:FtsX-like permease family protein [Gaiellaceae bacterium]
MRRVALRGLASRKLRSLLTAFAIVLGVAMVSGTFVLTDTIDSGFDTVFSESYEGADAVISPETEFGRQAAGSGGFPASVLEDVEALPSVAEAAGSVRDSARLIGRDGEPLGGSSVSPLALGLDPADEQFSPVRIVDGEWPDGSGQIAIDRRTFDDEGLALGDAISATARGPVQEFEIVGVVELGSLESLGGATISVFDLATAQELFAKEDVVDQIQLAAAEGVSAEALVAEVRGELPATLDVQTTAAQVETESEDTSAGLGFLRYFLLAFAAIALFVGSFVIANTLSITIGQRTRELATVRTLGASRRQVLWSVVLEALVVGVLASIVGILLGVGLALGLNELLAAAGIELPTSGLVLETRTIVVGLVVGIGITLLASIRPALRATRVPPIAAVREGSVLPPSRFARFGLPASLTLTAGAVALLLVGSLGDGLSAAPRLLAIGLGVILLFVGIALVAPRLVRPLASALGWPGTRIAGAAGRLARANAMRNPARTASTASALMIGLALVTLVAILAQGLRSTFVDSVDELFVADYAVVAEGGFNPLTPEVEEALAQAPGVEAVSGVRSGSGRIAGEDVGVSAVPGNIAETVAIRWDEGSDAVPGALGEDGAFVTREFADERDLELGSQLEIETPTGETLALAVEGIWEEPKGGSPFGQVAVSHEAFDPVFPEPRNDFTFVNVAGGITADAEAGLETALADFPDAKVQTRDEFKDESVASLSRVLNILYVLLALSVVVSLFGLVNTLVLTVFERTRELGMLRAVGMTRRQVRRMIRHESIVTALLGATLGIAIGVFLAALVTQALGDEGFSFALPIGSLVVFVLAAILVGVLAAIMPARRAARLDILEALRYE